jgi:hypothetical protein
MRRFVPGVLEMILLLYLLLVSMVIGFCFWV